jgi:hypothetical protein
MTRPCGILPTFLFLGSLTLAACGDNFNENKIEQILTERKAYPKSVESTVFCNDGATVKKVTEVGLVRDGFVTTPQHTAADIGKPLIYFTDKATPYFLPTSDTLKSFDAQKVRIATESFLRVVNIEINPSGNQAVVDYLTRIEDRTPFAVLYQQNMDDEQPRRTFFMHTAQGWEWNGKIVKMPAR